MNENKNMSSYYLDAFLDSYHEWTLHGKGLKYASRELRYCLNAKKQRLQEKGIVAQEALRTRERRDQRQPSEKRRSL